MAKRSDSFTSLSLAFTLACGLGTMGCLPKGDASESSALGDGVVFADADGTIVVYRRLLKDGIEFASLFRVDPVSEKQTFIGDITELNLGTELFLSKPGFAFHDVDTFWLYGNDGKQLATTKASDIVEDVSLSGGRAFLLGRLSKSGGKRLALVDAATMEVHEFEGSAGAIAGASFAHGSDALYVGYFESGSGQGHLLRWDAGALKTAGYPIDPATGLFADPNMDVALGLTVSSGSEVVVSPKDRWVSVAGLAVGVPYTGDPAIDIVDVLSGEVREADRVVAPTTFTFDDAFAVLTSAEDTTLLTLNLEDPTALPSLSGVHADNYAVSRTSRHIVGLWNRVVAPIPLAGATPTSLTGDLGLDFYVFLPGSKMYNVTRPLDGASELQSLDLGTGIVTKPIPGDFAGMTVLPSGSVVLSDTTAKTLSIVDPATDTVKKTLALPTLQ